MKGIRNENPYYKNNSKGTMDTLHINNNFIHIQSLHEQTSKHSVAYFNDAIGSDKRSSSIISHGKPIKNDKWSDISTRSPKKPKLSEPICIKPARDSNCESLSITAKGLNVKNNKLRLYPNIIIPTTIAKEIEIDHQTDEERMKEITSRVDQNSSKLQYSVLFQQNSTLSNPHSLLKNSKKRSSMKKFDIIPNPKSVITLKTDEESKDIFEKDDDEEKPSNEFLSTEVPETIIGSPTNNEAFLKVANLSLFGNSSKINCNFKFFKNQPTLQSM